VESQALRSAVRRLREVVSAPPAGPDADLLRAFAKRRDAGAFEQIVRRHGPMVLGVCRRVLRDAADADDAFQATFLVLIRKAGSLRAPDRLAGWLHQVAHRVARKARVLRLNRARRQGELFDVPAGGSPAEILWRELRPIFDAELDRLPDRLRLPAVLCLLEGHSKADAARVLGWPVGTLSCRLQRARERLRARLAARGLTLSAGALAVALFEGAGSAAVPDRLIASTIQSLTTAASGAAARALADGVTQAMFFAKVKTVAAAVLVVGVVGTGTGVVLVPGGGPVQVVAGEPTQGGPAKAPPMNPSEKNATPDTSGREALEGELSRLRQQSERLRPLVEKGTYPRAVWDDLQRNIKMKEAELKLFADKSDRAIQRQELELLKERLAFEYRMVMKGFMTESQLKKTRLEVERAEAELAKAEAPKAPDPRRAVLEDTVRTLEKLLDRTEAAFKQGTAGESEVLNARVRLNEAKLKLLELGDQPPQAAAPAATREYAAVIAAKENELARAEMLRKESAISPEELRRLRIDLHRLKADAATSQGEFGLAAKEREAVAAELDAKANDMRTLVEEKAAPRAELRRIEVALAEARIEAFKTGVRQQLASIVAAREEELREVRALQESKSISVEEVRRAEQAVANARARLAAER
jgi:RNA polymerase sigma factor (sigma-70 family)